MQNCYYYESGNWKRLEYHFKPREGQDQDAGLCQILSNYDFESISWKREELEGIEIFAYLEEDAYPYDNDTQVRYIVEVGFPETEAIVMVKDFVNLVKLMQELQPLIMITLVSLGHSILDEMDIGGGEEFGDDDDDDEGYLDD